MGKLVLVALSVVFVSCTTGMGKKMSQSTIDEIQAGKGKLSRSDVRTKIGASPQTQIQRGDLVCDSYTYTGMTNYFIFTKQDKGQSYNFCYDQNNTLVQVDGMQM